MPDSQEPKEVTNNNAPNSQFGGGLINAESVKAERIGGDIYNIHFGQQTVASDNSSSSLQRKERSQQERDSLEKVYMQQRQKVDRIQSAWVIETDPSRKFQYEQQLQKEENILKELGEKLDAIEQQLQNNLISLEIREQFLRGLAQDIDQYLSRAVPSLNTPIIQLESQQTSNLVESGTFQKKPLILPIAFFEMLPDNDQTSDKSTCTDFYTLFERYNGRVLLLGEPGSGKTITLMVFAKECIAKALKDVNQPLPLIAPIATWNAKASASLTDWLSQLMPVLNKDQIEKVLHEGKALLFLDGLDELGNITKNEDTGEEIDFRREFLKIIPSNNKILITCRSQDYQAISSKARLNSEITLQPLNDEQIRTYLRNFPGLFSVIESDNVLKELTRTPIILSLFTSAFEGLDHETHKLLNLNQGEVRDKILGTYIKRRFEVESRKIRSKILFTLEQIYDVLGLVAMQDAGGGGNMNIFHFVDFLKHLGNNTSQLLELVTLLNILYWEKGRVIRFTHMLLRDHFAFRYAQTSLAHPSGEIRDSAAWALWQIPDERAVTTLIPVLNDPYKYARGSAAAALGRIGNEDAVLPLIKLLADKEPVVSMYGDRICDIAAVSLEMIGSPQAIAAVESWKHSLSC
ncbi:NACHT domain-containing protein [Anabaena sp. CCY 9910]|uniref:NACHT domain-containing protein n=1 Tax=Anabaena sp. CCY 9910 TaxID=3103870 RepID=UPI0039E19FB8